MRKGLWSPDEDERLVRCITKCVNGSWSDIARKAGLERCGKSCRRRWMNHLRPNLKHGKFSMDEINLIVQLQEVLGNRWSNIATHLEGRTDNDVKNVWNTQIKKRLPQLRRQKSMEQSIAIGNYEETMGSNRSAGKANMVDGPSSTDNESDSRSGVTSPWNMPQLLQEATIPSPFGEDAIIDQPYAFPSCDSTDGTSSSASGAIDRTPPSTFVEFAKADSERFSASWKDHSITQSPHSVDTRLLQFNQASEKLNVNDNTMNTQTYPENPTPLLGLLSKGSEALFNHSSSTPFGIDGSRLGRSSTPFGIDGSRLGVDSWSTSKVLAEYFGSDFVPHLNTEGWRAATLSVDQSTCALPCRIDDRDVIEGYRPPSLSTTDRNCNELSTATEIFDGKTLQNDRSIDVDAALPSMMWSADLEAQLGMELESNMPTLSHWHKFIYNEERLI